MRDPPLRLGVFARPHERNYANIDPRKGAPKLWSRGEGIGVGPRKAA